MPPFRKLVGGSSFSDMSAGDWNTVLDHVRNADNGGDGNAPAVFAKQQTTLLLQNNAADIADVGGVLGIGNIIFAPTNDAVALPGFKSNPVFSGDMPSAANHTGKFAITLGPCIKGSCVRCVISGLAICKISVSTQTDYWADINDGTADNLQGGFGSAQILYQEASGSTRWAVVRIGGPVRTVIGKANTDIGVGSSGTFNIWTGNAGSEAANGRTIQASALAANLTSGKWSSAEFIDNVWRGTQLEC